MMQARRPFGAADIDKVVVHGSQVTADHVGWPYKPQGLTSAQLNLPFCVATLLIEGDVFVDQFSEAIVADPARMALAAKVEVRHDPAITALGPKLRHKVRVEVHLRDGTLERRPSRRSVAASRNSPARAMSSPSSASSRAAMMETQQAALIEAVLEMEQLSASKRLADLLRPQSIRNGRSEGRRGPATFCVAGLIRAIPDRSHNLDCTKPLSRSGRRGLVY